MNPGLVVLFFLLVILGAIALSRRDGSLSNGLRGGADQFVLILPRMFVAFTAAGFVGVLVPTELVSTYLGQDAGLKAILIASVLGLVIPAGAVVIFAVAAVLDRSGASLPALISFITAWSLFSGHRLMTYEIPMLGTSFLRLRFVSAIAMPTFAGLIAFAAGWIMSIGH